MWPADFTPALTAAPAGATPEIALVGEDLILTAENRFAPASRLAPLGEPHAAFVCGQRAGKPLTVAVWQAGTALPDGLQAVGLRAAFGLIDDTEWFLAARAKQLASWDRATRFCGACGQPITIATHEPAKLCTACGQHYYPQIAPAVMCLVRRGDALLLGRSPHFRAGMYSALAGFVEAGETVEACVAREVFEETGIRVTNLRWFASQPWPFPQSLMLAFHADYAGGEIRPQPGELEDAQWFTLDRLPDLPAPVSIASRLIAAGLAELRGKMVQ